jgi:hypothetical protein
MIAPTTVTAMLVTRPAPISVIPNARIIGQNDGAGISIESSEAFPV